jgi:FkbM family methyltransferase
MRKLTFKSVLKAFVSLTPYRIVRRSQNRFDGMRYSLELLHKYGYRPRIIIDSGAHLGSFALMAAAIFSGSEVHMIEPQRACHAALGALVGPFHLHGVGLGSEADAVMGLRLAAEDEPSSGAHISDQGEKITVSTLDELFDLKPSDRTFLKMDLQGYELQALKGGKRALQNIEVILTEVSFFAQAYEPSAAELINYLDRSGFDLFDIAALSGRVRDDRLKQGDLIFVRRGSEISRDKSWA